MSVQAEQQSLAASAGHWSADRARRHGRSLLPWLLLVLLISIGLSSAEGFGSGPVLLETLKGATFIGMAAAALFFVIVGGGIDLSIGSVATISGMAAAVIMGGHDHAIPFAVLASLAIGLLVGTINGLLVNVLKINPLIATFGMLYILQGVALTYSVDAVGQAAPSFYELYVGTVVGVPVLLLIVGAFWIACWYVARQTAFGKHLYAVGGDRDAARLAGVRTTRVSIASYILCSMIAAAAGLLSLTQTGVAAPNLGDTLLLATLAAVVIGGVSLFGGEGSVVGVLGAALLLGFLNQLFDTLQVSALYHQLIQGLIILVALAFYRQRVRT